MPLSQLFLLSLPSLLRAEDCARVFFQRSICFPCIPYLILALKLSTTQEERIMYQKDVAWKHVNTHEYMHTYIRDFVYPTSINSNDDNGNSSPYSNRKRLRSGKKEEEWLVRSFSDYFRSFPGWFPLATLSCRKLHFLLLEHSTYFVKNFLLYD